MNIMEKQISASPAAKATAKTIIQQKVKTLNLYGYAQA